MMLTVHGLPNKTKFQDVKALIKQECNIPDFILDNLEEDGYDSKKVRIGLTNENDGYRLMKCLEGFRMSGSHVLKVVPVGKPTIQPRPVFEPRSNYPNQPINEYSNQSRSDYQNLHNIGNRMGSSAVAPSPHTFHGNMGGPEPRQLDSRHSLLDSRPSQAMADSRHGRPDHYQGSLERPGQDKRPGLDARSHSDIRPRIHDPSRGPLAPPAIRGPLDSRAPQRSLDSKSMHTYDTRGHEGMDSLGPRGSFDSRGQISRGPNETMESRDSHIPMDSRSSQGHVNSRGPHGSLNRGLHSPLDSRGPHGILSRGPHSPLDSRGPRGPIDNRFHGPPDSRSLNGLLDSQPDLRPNLEPINQQPQWLPRAENDQWPTPTQHVPSQNTNYSYPQPGSAGYGPQVNNQKAPGKTPLLQGYPQTKNPIPDRRAHVAEAAPAPRPQPPLLPHHKPVPIMKDSYQGPTRYNVSGHAPHAHTHPSWSNQEQTKPLAYDKFYDGRRETEKRGDVALASYDKRGDVALASHDKRCYSPPRGRPHSPPRRISPPRNVPVNARLGQAYPETRLFQSERSPGRHATDTGRDVSPRRISPTRKISPNRRSPGRRVSPSRKISPSRRRVSPFRKLSPSRRRISPFRKISPSGRRVSPTGKRISPVRRDSPTGRRISPPGRRISPPGRRVSPHGRRISPPGRRISPGKRSSPRRDEPRRISPSERRMGVRVDSPRRYSPKKMSPSRGSERYSLNEKGPERYDDAAKGKPVRPAYEPSEAQKYSSAGFRPVETVPYPNTGARTEAKISPWVNEKITYALKKDEERMSRAGRVEEKSPVRRSRSRSPVKDRYRRHSPSPRSPRRSWALEKRRSPEVVREPPPPPLWPGQETEEKPKPVWESRADSEERFQEKRPRLDKKYSPRFSPRRDKDGYDKFEYEDRYTSLTPEKKVFSEIDKDFNDIYQRAVEFRRKTEELRKSQRRDDSEDRRREYHDKFGKEASPSERQKKPEWKPFQMTLNKNTDRESRVLPVTGIRLQPGIKAKRDKAVEEIANRILEAHDISGESRRRVYEELKLGIFNILMEMFKDKDVSYIELVIKFRARYDVKDEDKILQDVVNGLPVQYRNLLKRKGEGITEVPAKTSRVSPAYEREERNRPKLSDAANYMAIEPPKVLSMPVAPVINAPLLVTPPVYVPAYPEIAPQIYSEQQQLHMQANLQAKLQAEQSTSREEECYNLYLCQDDFEPFSDNQSERLRKFLVSQMFKASETGNGWAPDFCLKGLHSIYRYELSTKDEASKNWIISLDFSEFEFFNVLVYTKEELWYERAAVWLPGHSRYRNIEPLEKLRLQNRFAEGVNVGKWKFVKKVVTAKGTRLYVDMPPSSARALENLKMTLSYELTKVNVYLKAVAVDKDSFDAGLKEHSISDPSQIATAVQNTVMPTLPSSQIDVIRVTLNGAKSITIQQAGKIKEMIVYNLFKYHEQGGKSKTDFVKYGFLPPNCFGVVPENPDSRRWLLGRSFGKLNRQSIIVLDTDDTSTKYFKMWVKVPREHFFNPSSIVARLKQSNQGVKGLNFHLWKTMRVSTARSQAILEADIDLESVETIIKLKYQLDYVSERNTVAATFKSDYSTSKLHEKIRKYKSEQVDSYDVANMEIDSGSD